MTKHHHNLALKNAIFAHWNKYEFYADNWQEIQKHGHLNKKTTDKLICFTQMLKLPTDF